MLNINFIFPATAVTSIIQLILRFSIIILIYTETLQVLYIQSIGSCIGIYSRLLHVTFIYLVLDIVTTLSFLIYLNILFIGLQYNLSKNFKIIKQYTFTIFYFLFN
jgi:hypothetical protein